MPPPLPPLVVHLTASTAPATNQSNSTLISIADEQPPTNTHFGQGDDPEIRGVVTQKVQAKSTSNSLLDFVEPYRAVVPAPAQPADPAQPGAGEKIRHQLRSMFARCRRSAIRISTMLFI